MKAQSTHKAISLETVKNTLKADSTFVQLAHHTQHGLKKGYVGWYKQANEGLFDLWQRMEWDCSFAFFVAVVAATSPRCSVQENLRKAVLYMEKGLQSPPKVIKMHGASLCKLEAIGRFASIEAYASTMGVKTSAFALNLAGCEDACTIDVHMCAILFGAEHREHAQGKLKASGVYDMCKSLIEEVGALFGLANSEVQEAAWCNYVETLNKKPGHFNFAEF